MFERTRSHAEVPRSAKSAPPHLLVILALIKRGNYPCIGDHFRELSQSKYLSMNERARATPKRLLYAV